MTNWIEQRRGRLANEVNNHKTEWGDFEHPGVGNGGPDALLRQARQYIKENGKQARQKRTFGRNDAEIEEKYMSTYW